MFERKILGYVHLRVGPNKNFIIGLGQPFNDLIKLFNKKDYKFSRIRNLLFFISPLVLVLFSILIWRIFQHWRRNRNIKYFFLIIIVLNGLVTFFFLFPGWRSGSFYRTLGGYRSSAQSISYEGVFFFCILIFILISFCFNINFFNIISYFHQIILTFLLILYPWIIRILAERNRRPFDFAEGERELVSGFNTEYGSGIFSIIFLREYISMLFLSFFTRVVFLGKRSIFIFGILFFLLIYIWIRTCYPRLRYDKLILFSWKVLIIYITGIFVLYSYFFFF